MCSNITLNNRQKIIAKFPIKERKSSYKDLNEAVKDALKFAFRDINFRTLQEKSDCQKLVANLCIPPRKDKIEKLCQSSFSCDEVSLILNFFKNKEDEDSTTITDYLIERLALDDFITRFKVFFENEHPADETAFDKWHHETCDAFLEVFTKYYNDAKYGKAQKIINMMFKHLYCMVFDSPLPEFLPEQYFAHCHLTLDSFTLEWFYREVVDNWHDHLSKTYGSQITNGRKDSWSNLHFEDTEKSREYRIERYKEDPQCRLADKGKTNNEEKYHYMFFIDTIREFFLNSASDLKFTPEQKYYKDLTPFQAEFYIWPEIQLHLAAEALFGQSIGQEDMIEEMNVVKQNINKKTIQEKQKELDKKKKLNKKRGTQKLEQEINVLQMPVQDMKEAINIYRDLSLHKKISILQKKIEMLINYSARETNMES